MGNRVYSFLFFLFFTYSMSASDSLSLFLKQRKIGLGTSAGLISCGSLFYLNNIWYHEYERSKFHTFNDNTEWLQMDKCGHMITTYQTGRIIMETMQWAGFSKKQQALGGASGFLYMGIVEFMDGYSAGWGFSYGDIAANTLGSASAIVQKLIWNQQRLQLKVSFFPSKYAQYRSDQLGDTFLIQMLKDYNGQTYWLSINPTTFFKNEIKFPKWLNIAFGYGANGMLGARYNNVLAQDEKGNTFNFKRYRQYYFSLDVDLTRIKTKSKILKTVFSGLNIIKIPFPNLEWSEHKIKFNYY